MIRTFFDLGRLLRQRRELIAELIRREISERYAGEALGAAWAFGHPLISVGIYLVVFNYIFRSTGAALAPSPYDYATFLLAGLLPWLVTVEVLGKSSSVLFSHASLVKQIVFPVEVLPLKATLVTLVTHLVGTLAILAYILVQFKVLQASLLLLPVVMVLHFLFNLGLAYAIAAMALFIRDVKDIISVFCSVGLFITPTLYFAGGLPRAFHYVVAANPFSHMIYVYQDVVYYGALLHPASWGVFVALSLLTFPLGYLTFQKLRPAFGDLL